LRSHENSNLYEYFSQFGQIDKAFIIKDPATGESRCFGFVEFVDRSSVDAVFDQELHKIKGKKVECKPFGGTKMGKSDENLFDTFSKSKSSKTFPKKSNLKKSGFGKGGVYDSDLDSDKSYESGESGDYQSKPLAKDLKDSSSEKKPTIRKTKTSNNNGLNHYDKKQLTTIVRKP
jgi:RNA recognition motif-containing protein